MKKLIVVVLIVGTTFIFFGTKKGRVAKNVAISYVISSELVNEEGSVVSDRILLPEGYTRKTYPEGSFQQYIQQYPLENYGAKIINYNGQEYGYQSGHVGIFSLPVPENGLQQCADALIRIRAEYLWDKVRKDEIGFNFTSGHYFSWKEYAEGYRPKINGNRVTYFKIATQDVSEDNFYRYLNLIFMYSGTQSLFDELDPVEDISDVEVGDMLIYPGSPGHVIMVADVAIDEIGNKLFIFAQGNTPAQSVHILKNPNDKRISPWYDIEMGQYLEIPTYFFNEVKFIRFK
ncbi:MAG: DUF4846 domain-containing protein [Bacteroidia bacterium]|nr:DUF4846 domain-containing protein [Bacteroidia bacterium]NNF32052.1 DUF4846 domain-containing protein [Flavobacteriaceae bacterium]MBT8276503.1 DUF4846 domain-containing protein [Bacteroidia bacterium]NNJ83182.1 DUF4846 domain-containing protein [Flavobacteriaceae bacterium]NNK53428.1 DUF4846 domain-containing protein [Flavobacteriaceae bacterium]